MITFSQLSDSTKDSVKKAISDYKANNHAHYLELKNEEKMNRHLTFKGLAYISVFAALLEEEESNEPHMRYGRDLVKGFREKAKRITA